MGRPAKVKDDEPQNGGEVKKIDVDTALRIVRRDIKPNLAKVGEHNQELSTAYKAIRKDCNIPSWVIKLGLKLADTEDFKREHELRALHMVLSAMGISITPDLVDQAEGKGETNVVPLKAGSTASGGLATLDDDDEGEGDEELLRDEGMTDEEWDAAAPKAEAAE